MKENNVIFYRDKKKYEVLRKYLEDIKADFREEIKGTTETIFYKDKQYRYADVSSYSGRGHHLSRMVQRDVDAWLEKHGATLPHYQKDYKEQMFNISAIEQVIGVPSDMTDTNDCYWDTIYMLGYITEKTWISGKREKKWKLGRNASIGALASPIISYDYVKGKRKLKGRKKPYIPAKAEYQYIRNHVIGTVYRLFYGLFEILGANFYMFLTDCVVTDSDKRREVERYLTAHGYRYKHKPVEFTKVDTVKKKVSWWDPTNTKNKNKYYLYANSQVISSGLLEGKMGEEVKNDWLKMKKLRKKTL